MLQSGSVLQTIVQGVRSYVDEPEVDAKYTDDYIVNNVVSPAMVRAISKLNNSTSAKMVHTLTLKLTGGLQRFALPPNVMEVRRMVVQDGDGRMLYDYLPNHPLDWRGQKWRIEGVPGALSVVVDTLQVPEATVGLEYVTNGDFRPHYATDGSAASYVSDFTGATWTESTMTLGATGAFSNYTWRKGDMVELLSGSGLTPGDYEVASKTSDDAIVLKTSPSADGSDLTGIAGSTHAWYCDLSSAPALGLLDRRDNAYVGGVFSYLPTGATERMASALIVGHVWKGTKWTVEFDRPLAVGSTGASSLIYEVVPAGSAVLAEMLSAYGAWMLGAASKASSTHLKTLERVYREFAKTVGDRMTAIQVAEGKSWPRNTFRQREGLGWGIAR